VASGDTVVVISTAHGLKFPDFKIDYHSDNLKDNFGVEPEKINRPLEVDANYEQVRSSVLQSIDEISNLKT